MADLKDSLKTRDAIIFSGHSGYTYAYALASWYKTSAGDLDPPEIKTMSLPKDKSQLFVLSGCDTYHAAQAFKDNPNKLGLSNADVITTTSFSNAGDVGDTKDMIRALVGDARAATTGRLLRQGDEGPQPQHLRLRLGSLHHVRRARHRRQPPAQPLGRRDQDLRRLQPRRRLRRRAATSACGSTASEKVCAPSACTTTAAQPTRSAASSAAASAATSRAWPACPRAWAAA